MAEFKHKTNNGSVFKNNKKEITTHPDVVGAGNIDGKEYWINGWYTGKESPLMRFIFNAKDVTAEAANDNAQQPQAANDNTVEKPKVFVQQPK